MHGSASAELISRALPPRGGSGSGLVKFEPEDDNDYGYEPPEDRDDLKSQVQRLQVGACLSLSLGSRLGEAVESVLESLPCIIRSSTT